MNIFQRIHFAASTLFTVDNFGAEIFALTLLAARRCAYDLKHAADEISYTDTEKAKFFKDRADHWLSISNPVGIKQYQHSLHYEIQRLESRIDELEKLCEDNGIASGKLPF